MNTAKPDTHQHASLAQNVKGVLLLQGIACLMVLAFCLAYSVFADAEMNTAALLKASLYGSGLAIAGTWLSARSIRRATEVKGDKTIEQAPISLTPIFSGLLNKLVIVGGGIAFGLIFFKFNAVALIAAYLIVQMAGSMQLLFNR